MLPAAQEDPCCLSGLGVPAVLGLRQHHSSLPLSVHDLLLCVCMSLVTVRAVTGLRGHPGNLETLSQDHPKALFLVKCYFKVMGIMGIFGSDITLSTPFLAKGSQNSQSTKQSCWLGMCLS